MEITKELIPHIEKALGFKLFEHVAQSLCGEKVEWPKGRAVGHTTTYIIRQVLDVDGEPLRIRRVREWCDVPLNHPFNNASYSRWYAQKFLKIRRRLKAYGFPVRGVIGVKEGRNE